MSEGNGASEGEYIPMPPPYEKPPGHGNFRRGKVKATRSGRRKGQLPGKSDPIVIKRRLIAMPLWGAGYSARQVQEEVNRWLLSVGQLPISMSTINSDRLGLLQEWANDYTQSSSVVRTETLARLNQKLKRLHEMRHTIATRTDDVQVGLHRRKGGSGLGGRLRNETKLVRGNDLTPYDPAVEDENARNAMTAYQEGKLVRDDEAMVLRLEREIGQTIMDIATVAGVISKGTADEQALMEFQQIVLDAVETAGQMYGSDVRRMIEDGIREAVISQPVR